MLKIKEAIVVEGRYDKNTLSQMVDAVILETAGFGIFKNEKKLALFRKVAEECGLIVLTDSDGAGFVIRNFLKGAINPAYVKHAYIPDVYGKEKRKKQGGKEGKKGVEGMRPAVLEESLRRCGATILSSDTPQAETSTAKGKPITKADFCRDGLAGGTHAAENRQRIINHLDLPQHLTANALLTVLNTLFRYEEYTHMIDQLIKKTEEL